MYKPKPTRSAAAVAGMALLLGAALVSARQDPVTASAPREIEVVAKKFTFEPAKVEVTEGERIRLMVRSADGVHGIEIKKLRINKIVPREGTPVEIDFVAPAPGTYEMLCSEYCGDGHEAMTATLVVLAKPAKGPALDIPAEPSTGCQHHFHPTAPRTRGGGPGLARSARLGPLCSEAKRARDSRFGLHSGPK